MRISFVHIYLLIFGFFIFSCNQNNNEEKSKIPEYKLEFSNLPTRWDEAIPLGNGSIGALIWQKGNKLRFSLDRSDLWDIRPTGFLDNEEFTYAWIYEKWKTDNYKTVQDKFDNPYASSPAPTKIPAGALEFDISHLGEVASVTLFIKNGLCEVVWENGTKLSVFIDSKKEEGRFKFENLVGSNPLNPSLVAPAYNKDASKDNDGSVVVVQDLRSLGYPEGVIEKQDNQVTYTQEGWGSFKYQISAIFSEVKDNTKEGSWSISSHYPDKEKNEYAKSYLKTSGKVSFTESLKSHATWWKNYWEASSISLPDSILEKQWYLEQYKFGSIARKNTPPISLQAVWTADNGLIPPWKGDFHHDLNTQLSYWPSYSGNHLDLEEGFTNWLWNNRSEFYNYTKKFYQAEGLNVPGVTSLTGQPMGGWLQYSCGPTVSAWLGHHFYLHWRYSMDTEFLEEKAYPWIRDVAVFLDNISIKDEAGFRKLPISSSPEVFGNSKKAWFGKTSNFDLGLIRWTFEKASELAKELNLPEESKKWNKILQEWPDFDFEPSTGLTFAPGFPYDHSHRHFSHQIGYHPLGVIDISRGDKHKKIIENTIANIDKQGSEWYVGYSFSWLGGLKARAFDGEGAEKALKTFATAFCSPNSFHLNGDQTKTGLSNFTYRPFTLEGNFAFASGIQEMLIQSHTGVIRIFPAIPKDWNDVSFQKLRTEGAFLVSAKKINGVVSEVIIEATQGGKLTLVNPFKNKSFKSSKEYNLEDNIIRIETKKGDIINLKYHE